MNFNILKQFIQQGPLTFRIKGICMQRVLPDGSEVRFKSNRFYWPGDIIAFKRKDGEIVSHRFLGYLCGRRGWLAITRPDNVRLADSPVTLGHVLGRVTHVDGYLFQPCFMDRVNAQLAWFPAVARIIARRLRLPVTVLEET